MKSSSIGSNLFRDLEMIEEAQIFRTPILNLILAAVLQPSFLGSEQNNLPLNNEDVVKLAHSRLSESVIIRVIEAYESNFDTTRKAC